MTWTHSGTLLDAEGLLHVNQFEELMRDQMKRLVHRQLTNTLAIQQCTGSEEIQLMTMKAILQEQVIARKLATTDSVMLSWDLILKPYLHPCFEISYHVYESRQEPNHDRTA
jgi:hypothetical protein